MSMNISVLGHLEYFFMETWKLTSKNRIEVPCPTKALIVGIIYQKFSD